MSSLLSDNIDLFFIPLSPFQATQNRLMKSAIYLLLFFQIIALSTLQAQEKLGYNLKKGDVFRIEQQAIQHITQKMDSTEHKMTNNLYGVFNMEVINASQGKFVLDVQFETFKFRTESDLYGVFSDIDTSVPPASEDDIEAKIFQGLIGPKFQLVLLPSGQVESMSGIENLVNSMLEKAEIEDEFSKAIVKESVSKKFNNEDMRKSFQQFTYIYPETKVRAHDTWKNGYTGAVSAQNQWKLLAITDSDATLEGQSAIQLKVEEGSVIMELDGTQQTQVVSDPENGFIKTLAIEQQTEGTTIIPEMDHIEIPTSLNATITYKLL